LIKESRSSSQVGFVVCEAELVVHALEQGSFVLGIFVLIPSLDKALIVENAVVSDLGPHIPARPGISFDCEIEFVFQIFQLIADDFLAVTHGRRALSFLSFLLLGNLSSCSAGMGRAVRPPAVSVFNLT